MCNFNICKMLNYIFPNNTNKTYAIALYKICLSVFILIIVSVIGNVFFGRFIHLRDDYYKWDINVPMYTAGDPFQDSNIPCKIDELDGYFFAYHSPNPTDLYDIVKITDSYNTQFNAYRSELYKYVDKDLMLLISFGLLRCKTAYIYFNFVNCYSTDNEYFLFTYTLFSANSIRPGLMTVNKNNSDITYKYHDNSVPLEESKIYTPSFFIYIFFVMNCLLWITIIVYIIKYIKKILYNKWLTESELFINRYYINNDKYKFKNIEVLNKYRFEICSYLYMLEYSVDNYENNRINMKNATMVVFIQILVSTTPVISLITIGYYYKLHNISYFSYVIFISYNVINALYLSFYYLNLRWKYRIVISYVYHFCIIIVGFISIGYFSNVFLWLIVSLLISPINASTMIISIITIILYIYYMCKTIDEYKTTYNKHKNSKFAVNGLTIPELFGLVFYGFMIITFIIVWTILTQIVITNNSIFGIILISLGSPIAATLTYMQQIKDIKTKFTIANTNNISDNNIDISKNKNAIDHIIAIPLKNDNDNDVLNEDINEDIDLDKNISNDLEDNNIEMKINNISKNVKILI